MTKQRKSEFPNSTLTSPRNLMLGAIGLAVIATGLLAAQLTGVIHIPGLPGPLSGDDLEAHDYEATVTVGQDGFMPAALKVKPNTRVYFQNSTQANHSVDVSGKNPDAAFGSPDQIVPAGGYAFTFTRKGDYKFHDGTNPTANGEVIVE